jgi:hypothetical protein
MDLLLTPVTLRENQSMRLGINQVTMLRSQVYKKNPTIAGFIENRPNRLVYGSQFQIPPIETV